MLAERLKECVGLMMIGDGLMGVLEPRRHVSLWVKGPSWWRAMFEPFARRPALTRCVGACELLAGVWLASRQTAKAPARG